ncbi:MAG: hypothetical protein FH756_01190 [Firmicutes bacterium]|nr:hypothetical protein [Bacillota bacterium]
MSHTLLYPNKKRRFFLYLGCFDSEYLVDYDSVDVEDIHTGLVNELTPMPDWSCIWKVQRLQVPMDIGEG